jgi:hypothetical protein
MLSLLLVLLVSLHSLPHCHRDAHTPQCCMQDPALPHEAVAGFDEYLVPPALLDRLATLAGFEKLCSENFQTFFTRMSTVPNHQALLKKLNVLDWRGSLSAEEWETAGMTPLACPQLLALCWQVFASSPPKNHVLV